MKKLIAIALISLMFPVSTFAQDADVSIVADTAPVAIADEVSSPEVDPAPVMPIPSIGPAIPMTPVQPTEPIVTQNSGFTSVSNGRVQDDSRIQYLLELVGVVINLISQTIGK